MKLQLLSVQCLFLLTVFISSASADLGPKPTIDIDVFYEDAPIFDEQFFAKMMACFDNSRCGGSQRCGFDRGWGAGEILQELNVSISDQERGCMWRPSWFAWGGNCTGSTCHFGYMPPSEFRIVTFIPSLSRTFISNAVSRNNFESRYRLDLTRDGSAVIVETTPLLSRDTVSGFLVAFPITLVLEFLVAVVFSYFVRVRKKRLIFSVLVCNVVTLPFVWFVFPLLFAPSLVIGAAELFAVCVESFLLFRINSENLNAGKAILLAVLANATSFFVGGALFGILFFLFGLRF